MNGRNYINPSGLGHKFECKVQIAEDKYIMIFT